MTAQADVPVSLVRVTEARPARMLGSARRLFLHGFAVLAIAVLLGIAEALALWMGALLVGAGLIVAAAGLALVGFIGRLGSTSSKPE